MYCHSLKDFYLNIVYQDYEILLECDFNYKITKNYFLNIPIVTGIIIN